MSSTVRGRLVYAVPMWLLEETADRIVTATVPGAGTRQLAGPRLQLLGDLAANRARTQVVAWKTNRVLWVTRFGEAHAIGHFWNDRTDEFRGHYINLQTPLRRTPYGFEAIDHVLDIVVSPDGAWHWKDEDEFAEAESIELFTRSEVQAIRAEGERAIESLPAVLPTGWEDWRPDPEWAVQDLRLPAAMKDDAERQVRCDAR